MAFARIARKNYMGARLLVLAKFLQVLAAHHLYFSKVLAARKTDLTTARARENKHTARMLAKTIR